SQGTGVNLPPNSISWTLDSTQNQILSWNSGTREIIRIVVGSDRTEACVYDYAPATSGGPLSAPFVGAPDVNSEDVNHIRFCSRPVSPPTTTTLPPDTTTTTLPPDTTTTTNGPTAIPAIHNWGLIGMACVMAVLAMIKLRRRQQKI
ncbi:MAG: hypothetical protein ACRESZ_10735, partial [Methylococcales bacterium]